MDKKIETIEDVETIDELNILIGDDDLSDEEYEDLVNYILNKKQKQKAE